MGKGIKINFDVNDEIYEVYTSSDMNSEYVLYSNNIQNDSIIISGSPITQANKELYVKLITNNDQRIITITIEKPNVIASSPTPTPTRTPTRTPTPTNTPGLSPTPTNTPGLTPTVTPTNTLGLTPTVTPTVTPTMSTVFNVSDLVFTSYEEYDGNTPTLKYYDSVYSLYNSILIETNNVSNIMETVKSDNTSGIILGAKLYNSNDVLFNITGYMCYFVNNTPKYIKIENSIITEIGDITATTTVTGTTILFPYFTKGNDNTTGWGSLSDQGNWKHKLNINSDGLTLIYQFENGNYDQYINNTNSFIYGFNGIEYVCRPYFTIDRRVKNYNLPNGFKIPNMYRGTLIELVISVDVSPKEQIEITPEIDAIMLNIITNFNMGYNILVGK